jgi:hypothetical protein
MENVIACRIDMIREDGSLVTREEADREARTKLDNHIDTLLKLDNHKNINYDVHYEGPIVEGNTFRYTAFVEFHHGTS